MFQQYLADQGVWQPLADMLVTLWWVLKGLMLLIVLMAVHFWIRYLCASAEERAFLREGNRAFQLMRVGVMAGYAAAILPALDTGSSFALFVQTACTAIIVQAAAVMFERMLFFRIYQSMRKGDLIAGATLGMWAAVTGVLTYHVICSLQH